MSNENKGASDIRDCLNDDSTVVTDTTFWNRHKLVTIEDNVLSKYTSIWNYSKEFRLLPCPLDGAKPRLVNTHVSCSNPRCAMWDVLVIDDKWNNRFDGITISNRALRTWEEEYES